MALISDSSGDDSNSSDSSDSSDSSGIEDSCGGDSDSAGVCVLRACTIARLRSTLVSRVVAARLGSARLGSARFGSARLGSARLGSADSSLPARPDPTRLGATLNSTQFQHTHPLDDLRLLHTNPSRMCTTQSQSEDLTFIFPWCKRHEPLQCTAQDCNQACIPQRISGAKA